MLAAIAALAKLRSGDVVAAATIQADEINVGLSYDSRDPRLIMDQFRALRQTLEVAAAESGSEPAAQAARLAGDAVQELEAPGGTTSVPVRHRIKTILGLLSQASQGLAVTSAGAVALAGGLEAALKVYRIVETSF